MKDRIYFAYKDFKLWRNLKTAQLKRLFVKTTITGQDFFNVPIIINNRNRLTFLKQLIEWLEKKGYKNIYIIDNDSTYGPLLEYYKHCSHHIFFLKKNIGYKSIWETDIFDQFKNSYYVYTDPDVMPTDLCPENIVEKLYNVLKKYPSIEKAGVALKIDDLPDHYSGKEEVLRIEKEWWLKIVDKDIYDAPVDTTFAIYRPYAKGIAEECKAYRVGGDLIFRHMPWYENSSNPAEEDIYYRNSVTKESSYWLNFK